MGCAFDAWLAVVDDHLVGEVGRHDEVVLDDEGSLLVVEDEALDDSSADDSLLTVQVSGRLVDEIGVSTFGQGENDGNSLQFSS